MCIRDSDDLREESLAGRLGGVGGCYLFLAARRRNGDVDRLDGTERREGLVEVGALADDEDREVLSPHMLLRDALDVLGGHLLDFRPVAVEEVRRVAVERIERLLAEDLLL